MALPDRGSKSSVRWLRVPAEPAEFVVLSQLRWWASHWDARLQRSFRCGGEWCKACADGAEVTYRYVVMVEDVNGERFLLEIPRRLRTLLESLDDLGRDCPGVQLRVGRQSRRPGGRIAIEIVAHVKKETVEILPLVETLGLSPRLLDDDEARNPEEILRPDRPDLGKILDEVTEARKL